MKKVKSTKYALWRTSEEDDWIGPAVRSPNVALLVDLEEGEVVARHFGYVEVGWLGVMAAVVPIM